MPERLGKCSEYAESPQDAGSLDDANGIGPPARPACVHDRLPAERAGRGHGGKVSLDRGRLGFSLTTPTDVDRRLSREYRRKTCEFGRQVRDTHSDTDCAAL